MDRGVIDPAVALVAPADVPTSLQHPLHGLELAEIGCAGELGRVRLEPLDQPATVGQRIETRFGRAVVAGIEARHRSLSLAAGHRGPPRRSLCWPLRHGYRH